MWVGDFYEPGPIFTVPGYHESGWVAGYDLDARGFPTANVTYEQGGVMSRGREVLKPDRVIFVTPGVQGVLVCPDVLALSLAFGLHDSTLALYDNPLLGPGSGQVSLPGGNEAAGYRLPPSPLHEVPLPTGSEDLDCECDEREAKVLFESASYIYRTPIRIAGGNIEDRTFTFDLPKFLL